MSPTSFLLSTKRRQFPLSHHVIAGNKPRSLTQDRTLSSLDPVEKVDYISNLPDDLLTMMLAKVSTEQAMKTSVLAKRWEHVWKQRSHLVLDMQRFDDARKMLDVSNLVATRMTKIINDHRGDLESCVIDHYSYQYENGTLNTWIQTLNGVKHTKHLTLRHHIELMNRGKFLDFPTNSFSYPTLASLALQGHVLKTSRAFNNSHLKTLKLLCIFAAEVGVFNRVLASCPALEVLVLQVSCFKKSGPLKIDNKRLEFLKVSSCKNIDGIEISSTSLHILFIDMNYWRNDKFVLTAPRLQFNPNFWLTRSVFPYINYNISQEEKSIGHEELINISGELFGASLSVKVDLMNEREVERLRQVLLLVTFRMLTLEICFKNNNAPRKEGESSRPWNEINKVPFPDSKFRVDTVWMNNFSGSEEEFALASCFVSQGTVVKKMMIKTSSFSARKKLKIEAEVAKLMELGSKYQSELTIKCF